MPPRHLQVIPATTYLAAPEPLQGSVLFTGISTVAIAEALVSQLQDRFGGAHPATVMSGLSSESNGLTSPTLDLCLQDLLPDTYPRFPWTLYLPLAHPTLLALQELIDVVAQLRSPVGGCPWDLAQTPETLIPYVLEEAYEVVDAIRQGEPRAIADELGDLLLQVVLQAQIAGEQQQFSLEDVARNISTKLIRRHPHVFAGLKVESIEEVRQNWEEIKANERGAAIDQPPPLSQKLRRLVRILPPLQAGQKIDQQASALGFDWQDITRVWDKFYEELTEFQDALLQSDSTHQEAELGDLLFSLVILSRWCQIDPQSALRGTYDRFIRRIEKIEAMIDQPLNSYTLEELESFWRQAKAELRAAE